MNRIAGKIIDALTNTPISDAVILLNKVNSSSIDIAQLSNDKGKFQWVKLDIGDYIIKIVAETYKSQVLYVTCNIDSQIKLLISLLK